MSSTNNNVASNIIQILANLPDFLRKPMLQNRLKEFYAMSDEDRRETITMALSGAPMIDPNKLSVLFRTWLEVLSEFDAEKRVIMFQTYCRQILANARQIEKLDFKLLTATFLSLDQKQRERLTDSLQEVLFSFPNRNEILKLVPEDSLKAIGLK
ncbi:MAG: hypothetical protein QXX64_05520 [Nitrososphaera sp.]|uniref:Uncharacterized protein n=1 Tax=Nitrososphaera gargensis (strain Ga9.2) TaxID=1237085 RepID=K0IJT1_NITGG|nr:hypothetical protein [Candidatus Nitrososphaera gargensis]AFU60345.1 hypothetical protein Ngar_c34300 [Candidatus Nitrososphaera gargensis Ga9.2]